MRHAIDFNTFDLRPELKAIVEDSDLSLRQLSAICGINKTRLSAILNCKAPLTVGDLQLLGLALGFEPRDLLAPIARFDVAENSSPESLLKQKAAKVAKQLFASAEQKFEARGDELTIDTMLKWFTRNGGRLEDTDKIEKYITLFQAPKPMENLLIPRQIGKEALVARSLNARDPQQVGNFFAALDPKTRDEILYTYSATDKEGSWKVYERNVFVDFPNAGYKFSVNYATLLMPVIAANKERLVVNFSILLSTEFSDEEPALELSCD